MRRKYDVVAHGPSLRDENAYYMIRRFESPAQRDEMEDAIVDGLRKNLKAG